MLYNTPNSSALPIAFSRYVKTNKALAEQEHISWDIVLDDSGIATGGTAWDLRKIAKDGNPASSKLRSLCTLPEAVAEMASQEISHALSSNINRQPISICWQDLLKSYVISQILVAGRGISYVTATCTAIRQIATVKNNKLPWQLTPDDINLCITIAIGMQRSGQMVVLIRTFVKVVLDANHLTDASPLLPFIDSSRLRIPGNVHQAKHVKSVSLRDTLHSRKSEEKLPEMRAFWELMRIIFTEQPRSFFDAIRFAQTKLLILTGLRAGEIALLPLDWKRTQNYYGADKTLAGKYGGISSATLLRYFAEKQGSSRKKGGTLWDETQFIPPMFEKILCETLEEVERLTAPLRSTLKRQVETGRLLPLHPKNRLLTIRSFYFYLTGMTLTTQVPQSILEPYLTRYRATYDLSILDNLIALQHKEGYKLRGSLYQFANRLKDTGLVIRDMYGNPFDGRGVVNAYVLVGEAEDYIRTEIPSKLSDLTPFNLDGGRVVQPWEMLFLIPKRALGEAKHNVPCHVGLIAAIGIATSEIIVAGLSGVEDATPNLFQIYGETEDDRKLSLLPHSLRHLQNTELFRLGVADTIITKRFNRRSVSQSYEYDHRSLQEELEHLSLPNEWDAYLGDKAGSVAKLIKAGRANGPIVSEFKRIQVQEGDEAAYTFLKAEADGFHATPYGHCLNSFTVDPCPTHLECFNGCVHLSATDLPENRRNLVILEGKLRDALNLARARDSSAIGRDNQIHHAEVRIQNIERLLRSAPGERAFPDGVDLSKQQSVRSVIDGA